MSRPTMFPVEGSSNVAAIGYDAINRVMFVEFHGGKVYRHENVSPNAHAEFVKSDSKGRHYHENFRNKHVKEAHG